MNKYEELYDMLTEVYKKRGEDPGLHCGLLEYTFKDIIDVYSTWLLNNGQGSIGRLDDEGYVETQYGIHNGKETTEKWGNLEDRKELAMVFIRQKIETARRDKGLGENTECEIVDSVLEEYFTEEEYKEVGDELIGFARGYICKAMNPDKPAQKLKSPF